MVSGEERAAQREDRPGDRSGALPIRAESFDPRTYPIEPSWFERPNSIHGVSHTRRVLIHAVAIAPAAGLDGGEFDSLVHAVLWHDIGRTHDGCDQAHGAKSVARVESLGLDRGMAGGMHTPTPVRVFFAMELHSTADAAAVARTATLPDTDRESFLRVLWVLKDADGLDRVRIDDLDPAQLRHPSSRERVDVAWRLLAELP